MDIRDVLKTPCYNEGEEAKTFKTSETIAKVAPTDAPDWLDDPHGLIDRFSEARQIRYEISYHAHLTGSGIANLSNFKDMIEAFGDNEELKEILSKLDSRCIYATFEDDEGEYCTNLLCHINEQTDRPYFLIFERSFFAEMEHDYETYPDMDAVMAYGIY